MEALRRLLVLLASASLCAACGDSRRPSAMDASVPNDGSAPAHDAASMDSAVRPDAPAAPDAFVSDAFVPDAFVPSTCPATGDRVESSDASNDPYTGTPEPIARSFTGAGEAFTVGGCLDPAHAVDADSDGVIDFSDSDAFRFTVAGAAPSWITLDFSVSRSGSRVRVFITDVAAEILHAEVSVTDHGTLPPLRLAPGDYLLLVEYDGPGLSEVLTYSAVISPLSCTSARGAAADYAEANDGAGHRGNDVATVSWSSGFTAALTSDASDAPEPTEVHLRAGDRVLLTGVTAAIASAGDDYLDRDTFEINTAGDPLRVAILLEWDDASGPRDMDMDLVVWPWWSVSSSSPVAIGDFTDTADEARGAMLDSPHQQYWLWVGTYDDGPTIAPAGAPYSITICAFPF